MPAQKGGSGWILKMKLWYQGNDQKYAYTYACIYVRRYVREKIKKRACFTFTVHQSILFIYWLTRVRHIKGHKKKLGQLYSDDTTLARVRHIVGVVGHLGTFDGVWAIQEGEGTEQI